MQQVAPKHTTTAGEKPSQLHFSFVSFAQLRLAAGSCVDLVDMKSRTPTTVVQTESKLLVACLFFRVP
jgi:hypothetical protein